MIQYRREEIREYRLQAVKAIMEAYPEWTDSQLGAALSMTPSGVSYMRRELGIETLNSNHTKKILKQLKPKGNK